MELALPPEWIADLPTDRPLTADDVLRLPEGPPHVELIDGELIVNASPVRPHARVARNLFLALNPVCPPHLEVFPTPIDWVLDQHNVFEPDLTVAEREAIGDGPLRRTAVLVVEVLSPSTRRRDLTVKRAHYERSGVLAYWIVDPHGPRFTALERDATGGFTEAGAFDGAGTFTTTIPFPLTLEVGSLLD